MKEILKPNKQLRKILPPQKVQRGAEYVPSQFALSFDWDEKHYVFNSLTRQCIEAKLPLSCTAGEGYDDLIAGYFLIPKGKDECAFYESLLALLKAYYKYSIQDYTILTTLACNARCVYCYEEGIVPIVITPETADQTVRFIRRTYDPKKKVRLSWFGGEPLLEEQIIDRICSGLREEGIEYYSFMTSNGSLITPAVIERMKDLWNLKNILISMDGAEDDYRNRKRYCEYHDEYHTVMDAISQMSAAGIQVTVRCNLDEKNLPGIPRYLEEMQRGIADKNNVTVFFALLDEVRAGSNDLNMWKEILALESQIAAAGFIPSDREDDGIDLKIYHCTASQGCPVISPDGSLYPCRHCLQGIKYGDVWHGVTNEKAKAAFCSSDHVKAKCRDCCFLPLCTPFTGCPAKDKYCREVKRLLTENTLCRIAAKKEPEAETAEEKVFHC